MLAGLLCEWLLLALRKSEKRNAKHAPRTCKLRCWADPRTARTLATSPRRARPRHLGAQQAALRPRMTNAAGPMPVLPLIPGPADPRPEWPVRATLLLCVHTFKKPLRARLTMRGRLLQGYDKFLSVEKYLDRNKCALRSLLAFLVLHRCVMMRHTRTPRLLINEINANHERKTCAGHFSRQTPCGSFSLFPSSFEHTDTRLTQLLPNHDQTGGSYAERRAHT